MNVDTEIKVKGLALLTEHLGSVEAERFVAIIQREKFDYTKWRQNLFSGLSGEEISRKPSFMCNLMSVDPQGSKITVSHCVAPLKLKGRDKPPLKYRLHSYHGFENGAVPEVEFPRNGHVLTGGFSKDLKSFALWAGRIESQVMDTENARTENGPIDTACANTMDVRIKDIDRFLQNIPGLHQIMILGDYSGGIKDALTGMHVKLVGPVDFTPPKA